MENPHLSTRQVALETGISQKSVIRIRQRNKFRPYKLWVSQTLQSDDPNKRLHFCRWFSALQFKVLWTDKTKIHKVGDVQQA